MKRFDMKFGILTLAVIGSLAIAEAKEVKKGYLVELNYTGKLTDGRVFDSNLGRGPLEFVVGDGQMLEDFEKGIIGMKPNEKKTIRIPADKAYGEVDSGKIISVPKNQMPDQKVEIGTRLNMRSIQGTFPVRVVEIGESTVYVDANHLLAGKDLVFDIELISTKKEKDTKIN